MNTNPWPPNARALGFNILNSAFLIDATGGGSAPTHVGGSHLGWRVHFVQWVEHLRLPEHCSTPRYDRH